MNDEAAVRDGEEPVQDQTAENCCRQADPYAAKHRGQDDNDKNEQRGGREREVGREGSFSGA